MASGYKYNLKKQLANRNKVAKRIAKLNRSLSNVLNASAFNVWQMFPKSIIGGTSKAVTSNAYSGFVSVDLFKVANKIDLKLLDDPRVDNVMREIMKEAQERAPVDKRYIGMRPTKKDLKSMKFSVPMFRDLDEREKPKTYTSDETNHREVSYTYGRRIVENSGRNRKSGDEETVFKNIDIFKDFSLEKQRMIRRLLTTGVGKDKLRADKRSLWYNEKENSLNWYRASSPTKKNIKLATSFGDERLHAGEEELRRSARYNERLKVISFDTTRLGTKYNYAALQHDRLDFTHKVGEPMFLYNAYMKNRQNLISAIEEVLSEKILSSQHKPSTSGSKELNVESERMLKSRVNRQTSISSKTLRKYTRGL